MILFMMKMIFVHYYMFPAGTEHRSKIEATFIQRHDVALI